MNIGAIEDVPRLDIRQFRRRGWLVEGMTTAHVISWNKYQSVEGALAAGIHCNMEDDPANLFVLIAYGYIPEAATIEQVKIIARQSPFGGKRYYFQCPILGRPCEVLALGPKGFASPKANHLTYKTQSQTSLGRLLTAGNRVHERLWPQNGGRYAARGKHRDRLFDRWAAIEMKLDEIAG